LRSLSDRELKRLRSEILPTRDSRYDIVVRMLVDTTTLLFTIKIHGIWRFENLGIFFLTKAWRLMEEA
jgi:hypothetical protein